MKCQDDPPTAPARGKQIQMELIFQGFSEILLQFPVVLVRTIDRTVYISGIPSGLKGAQDAAQDFLVMLE